MKTIIITRKDGSVVIAPKDSPLLESVNVHEIESVEWIRKVEYEPHFAPTFLRTK